MPEEQKKRSEPDFIAIPFSVIKTITRMEKEQAGSVIQVLSSYAVSVVNGEPQNDIAERSGDIVAIMTFESAKKTIDRTLNQFFIKSENGKKGGAPKGNQNAKKKKSDQDGEPAKDPEDNKAEYQAAAPLPFELDPEPNEHLSIDSFIQYRVAKMFYEIHEMPNIYFEVDNDEAKAQILAFSSVSGSLKEWKEKLFGESVKTIHEMCGVSMDLYQSETGKSESDFYEEVRRATQYALKVQKYRVDTVANALKEYDKTHF